MTTTAGRPSRTSQGLRNAVVFGGGMAFSRGLSFVLLPVYTRDIRPAEYGTLSLLLAISTAAGFLLAFGLDLPFYRTYFQLARDPPRQQLFIDSIWRFTLLAPVLLAVVAGAIAWPFLGRLPRINGLDGMLTLLAAALYVAGSTVPMQITRIEERLKAFLTLTLVNGAATAACTMVAVVVLHEGITGWLLAAVASNAIVLVLAAWVVPWHVRGGFDRKQLTDALRFGVPLIPHNVAFWALLLADRFVLAVLVPSRQLGVYALGANLALPVMISVQALNQGLLSNYARAGADLEDQASLDRTVALQITLTLFLTLAGVLLARPVIALLAAPAYQGAAPVLAWTVVGFGLLGLYYLPLNGTTLGAGRKNGVWVTTVLAAATNLGALFVVVPSGGIVAAAVASAGGYLVLLMTMFVYARGPKLSHRRPLRRRNPVRYPWTRIATLGTVAAGLFVAGSYALPDTGWIAIASRLGAALAYFPILMAMGIFPRPRTVPGRLRWRARSSEMTTPEPLALGTGGGGTPAE